MDTPGTLWGKLENPLYARHLAYIGSVRDEVVDMTELAADFLEEMAENIPKDSEKDIKPNCSKKARTCLRVYAVREDVCLRAANRIWKEAQRA